MKRTRSFVQMACLASSIGLLVPGLEAQFSIDSTGVTGPTHAYDSISSEDIFDLQFAPSSAHLALGNSVSITVDAPVGFQFVVDPPPADIWSAELTFYVDFGSGAFGSILGTNPSLTFGGVAGTVPALAYHDVSVSLAGDHLFASATADLTAATAGFAFTSVTFGFDYNNAGMADVELGAFNEGYISYILNFADPTSADLSNPWMRLTPVPIPEPAGSGVFAVSLLAAVAGSRVCGRRRA